MVAGKKRLKMKGERKVQSIKSDVSFIKGMQRRTLPLKNYEEPGVIYISANSVRYLIFHGYSVYI